MNQRNTPAVVLLLLGSTSILLGTLDSLVSLAAVFWALGLVLFLAAAGVAANAYRKARKSVRRT
ncbi:hypothetical protein [Paeniglutamicibacter antarcticus]|uniref:Uncharacterized protein n=1 Tax=Paeniglutamicibacter antarcticus TaxID=494023 RepID=A0ABP9TPB2_9MICC